MTIASDYAPDTYPGNDLGYTFSFTFPINAKSELIVTKISGGVSSVLTEGSNGYSVSWLGAGRTGSVTLLTGGVNNPLATGDTVILSRLVTYTQTTDLANNQRFLAESVERGLDRLEMQIQQVARTGGLGDVTQADLDDEAAIRAAADSSLAAQIPETAIAMALIFG